MQDKKKITEIIFHRGDKTKYRAVEVGHLSNSQVLATMLQRGIGRSQIITHKHTER